MHESWMRVDVRDRLYTTGDIIEGEVVLALSEPKTPASRLLVELSCVELRGLQKVSDCVWHRRWRTNLLSSPVIFQRGRHKIPFAMRIRETSVGCPSAIPHSAFGGLDVWITWFLQAWIEVDQSRSCSKACLASYNFDAIKVFPANGDHNGTNYLHQMKMTASGAKIWITEGPCKLPQPPDSFSLQVVIAPSKSIAECSISVHLERTLHVTIDHVERTLVSREDLCVMARQVCKREGRNETHLVKCQLRSITCSSFKASYVQVSYNLLIRLHHAEVETVRYPIDVAPIQSQNAPFSQLKQKKCLIQ